MEMKPLSDPKSSVQKKGNKPPCIPITNGEQMNSPLLISSHLPSTRNFLNSTGTSNLDKAIEFELKHGRKLDPEMDQKKLRRTVSNRMSSHRCRLRKAQYVIDMETKVVELKGTMKYLEENIKRVLQKRRLLKHQNEMLHQLLALHQTQADHAQIVFARNNTELIRLKEVEKAMSKMSIDNSGWSSSSTAAVVDSKKNITKV